ncbi:Fc.00g052120.m01.CDS01 [Cosmosporella sp. VM-42]
MSQEQAPLPLPPRNAFIHNSAIAGAVIAPLAMLLPPRKMDMRFFVLAGAFSLATNQLCYEYTGSSIYGRFGSRMGSMVGTDLPEGAKRTQQLLREQRERDAAQKAKEAEEKKGVVKLLNDTWMGGEAEDWKEQRAEEHRKKFEEGKGIGDLIMDQVADVWNGNWGKSAKKEGGEANSNEPNKK